MPTAMKPFIERKVSRMTATEKRSAEFEAPRPSNPLEQLEILAQLRNTGVITEEEFRAAKTSILSRL